MPVTIASMLDFSKLRTPANHGEVLVAPESGRWAALTKTNDATLRNCETAVLGRPLAFWRRHTREAIAGGDDRPVVVTGHQPGFFHPGVWAKHIAATRFAEAIGGVAIDLIVDNDAAKETSVKIPVPDSGSVVSVPFAHVPSGHTYEQIPSRTRADLARCEAAARAAMGPRYAASQLPLFISAASSAATVRDWVGQMAAGRQAIEAPFGVVLESRRVSEIWSTPLVVDMLLQAPRFRSSYNRALATYRRENHVRSDRRPIPDLLRVDDRHEVPLWLHRADQPRHRAFVARRGDTLQLYAGETALGPIGIAGLDSSGTLASRLDDGQGWALRPRALTLTIWARLLLADLFIHGIGGAKYDRISNTIMSDYYGVTPPHMVCVTGTLHLGLPSSSTTGESVARLQHELRDLSRNPQRHLASTGGLEPLLVQRFRAVQESDDLRRLEPHRHDARREVFDRIHSLNGRLAGHAAAEQSRIRMALSAAVEELRRNRISRGREYFFGLYDRLTLQQLAAALPKRHSFGV